MDHRLLGKFTADNTVWRPTMRLRWLMEECVSWKNPSPSTELQQCWLSDAGAEEWRPIPTVVEELPRQD